MRNILIISILSWLTLTSCTSNERDKKESLETLLKDRYNISIQRYKAVVLIPSSGCNECINEAEGLLQQEFNKDVSDYLFLITGYEHSKTAKIRLGESALGKNYILLDTLSHFTPFINNGKPIVYRIENNKFYEARIDYSNNIYTLN